MDVNTLRKKLAAVSQDHLLRFSDGLDHAEKQTLLSQIQFLDFANLADLARTYVRAKAATPLPKDIQPPNAFPKCPDPARKALYEQAESRGRQLLTGGNIAAFLVAGGQGTRLGYDGPKGEYPVTPVRNKPLFQVFAEQLLAHSRRSGKTIPWYIMTSDINDLPTRAFFQKHHFFGYDESAVFFFQQGMMPAFSMDGRILLADKGSLALSPDGHGGSLRALARSGALDDMHKRGIEHLSYFQVDNPMVHCIDPLFLGLHDLTASEMSSKIIPKSGPLEKVGNFIRGDGATQVIEYSDMPESLALQTNADGSLRFNAGSIAIHALRVDFIQRLNSGSNLKLPWHRAEKKVPFVNDKGEIIKPEKPNAVKLEQFIFDAIPLAKNALVYTTERAEEFSPVKNAEGNDSPETCRRDQIRRAARWLRSAGIELPMRGEDPDISIEISPLLAVSAAELRAKPPKVRTLKSGDSLYLE